MHKLDKLRIHGRGQTHSLQAREVSHRASRSRRHIVLDGVALSRIKTYRQKVLFLSACVASVDCSVNRIWEAAKDRDTRPFVRHMRKSNSRRSSYRHEEAASLDAMEMLGIR